MKISGPDSLTVNQQGSEDYCLATGNVVVGEEGGLTRAYFELRIDRGSSEYDEGLGGFYIGAVREGLDHDAQHWLSNSACLYMHNGSLHGNGKRGSDEQGHDTIKVGD